MRVATQLRKELHVESIEEVFWTDSKVVIGYISNESQRFHVYVANRVQEIRDKTSPKQWKYMETKSNPADEGSRGIGARDLMNSKWICDPEFLWKNEDLWPQSMATQREISTDTCKQVPEVKGSVTMAMVSAPQVSFSDRMKYFSDWFCAKRWVALCLRYLTKLKQRSHKKGKFASPRESTIQMPGSKQGTPYPCHS